MDQEEIDYLRSKLHDKFWRLTSGKVYSIMDKDGNIVPFEPNIHQLNFFKAKILYRRLCVPKARQLGISTAEDLWDFDDVLMYRNVTAGIIADTIKNAKQIFRQKIMVFWNNLAPRVKYENGRNGKMNWKPNTSSSNELSFDDTNSIISVDTSFRGGTLQLLHVSEYGKICAKFPGKADEIKTGAFETVATNQWIVVESTAMGAFGDFYDMCMAARDTLVEGRKPSDMEFYLMFYPRWIEKRYRSDANISFTEDEMEYFKILASMGIPLDKYQRTWYTLKKRVLKDKMYREYPSTLEEAFLLVTAGSYYEEELNAARQDKRICRVPYDRNLLVHTAWDIGGAGGGDDTSIWFWQEYGNEIRIIDYWEGNRKSFRNILQNVIKTKGYKYGHMYGPHDMEVTEYGDGKKRWQVALEEGFTFEIIERLLISEGIDMVRDVFGRCYFDEEKTKKGLGRLSTYQRKFNDKYNMYNDEVLKNGSQHAADSFRYVATAITGGHTYIPKIDITSPDYQLS